MKVPALKFPLVLNIAILIVSGIISFFTLLFGFAHVIEGVKQLVTGTVPDIPAGEMAMGWMIVFVLCVIGIVTLIVTLAAIKGIFQNLRKS